jgi:hypothetical protein
MSYLLTVSAFPPAEESSRLIFSLVVSFLSQTAKYKNVELKYS